MAKYPDIFPPESITAEMFFKFYAQVCTRCFGWGLPSTSLIPMADNCNHSDVTVVQEIINKQMHLDAEPGISYFTKTKMMNDYWINFNKEDYENDPVRTANVKGRFNKANYNANSKFSAIDKIKASLDAGCQTWEVACFRDCYEEDNDTEEEE